MCILLLMYLHLDLINLVCQYVPKLTLQDWIEIEIVKNPIDSQLCDIHRLNFIKELFQPKEFLHNANSYGTPVYNKILMHYASNITNLSKEEINILKLHCYIKHYANIASDTYPVLKKWDFPYIINETSPGKHQWNLIFKMVKNTELYVVLLNILYHQI